MREREREASCVPVNAACKLANEYALSKVCNLCGSLYGPSVASLESL